MGELRQLNEQNKLALWAERGSECRNSGQSVLIWCKEHRICIYTQVAFSFYRAIEKRRVLFGIKENPTGGNAVRIRAQTVRFALLSFFVLWECSVNRQEFHGK